MLTGIKFWQTVKSLSINAKLKNSQQKANRIIYIGKNEVTFAKIKTKIKPELAIFHQGISIKDILANKPNKLIFDINYFSYKTVFSVMEKLKNQPISFRFIPKNTNFIIGSDSNNTKGEVLVLD
jgi:hypothetical protein